MEYSTSNALTLSIFPAKHIPFELLALLYEVDGSNTSYFENVKLQKRQFQKVFDSSAKEDIITSSIIESTPTEYALSE